MSWTTTDMSATNTMDADGNSEMSYTSSLQYLNSQLIAHGFAYNPGISLDGLSMQNMESVVKVLLSLMNQRVRDMERIDELNTNARTTGYDNDRLRSMHQTAVEAAGNAEREMNVWKSRASAAEKVTETTEKKFKILTQENQRLRTTLQSVRLGAQNEVKKFEKEKNKLLERLSKIADSKQTTTAQFVCPNLDVSATQGRFEKGYLDIALEDAENARVNLAEENDVLKKLVVDCANGAQGLLHRIKYRGDERHMVDEPTPVTEAQLFPLAPMNAAREAFKGILHAVDDAIEKRLDNIPDSNDPHNADVAKLNAIVQDLRNELGKLSLLFELVLDLRHRFFADQARCHTSDYASQARSLVDKFIKGQDSSRVLSSPPDVDSEPTSMEKRRLQAERDELNEDRRNLTEAALKLGRERAALEVQRLEFLEDRRAWDVKKMIDDLPPSPKATGAPTSSTIVKSALKKKLASPSRRKSKSPLKPQVSKQKRRTSIVAGASKKGRKSVKFGSPPKKVAPMQTLDTELIPPSPPPPSRETIARMTSVEDLLASCTQPKELVTTEFVLPPRSPQSSLPPPPKPTSRAPPPPFKLSAPSVTPDYSPLDHAPQPSTSDAHQLPPKSPSRPFPVAKPFAQRMIHAYSPVKPSPLSRVLTAYSASPPRELPVASSGNSEDPFDSMAVDSANTPMSPRKVKPPATKKTTTASAASKSKPKVEAKKPVTMTTTRDKGKAKVTESKAQEKVPVKPTTRTRTATAAGLDKENTVAKRQKLDPPTSPTKPPPPAGSRVTTSSKTTTKPPPPRTRPRPGVTGATTSSTARSTGTTTTTRAGMRRVAAPQPKR
ncbi:Afadin and alpha-actinin-binding-domain-containing protein [Thelephora terrestris]|uniref:Afadin and alpha-actinin-binding-domain-containing protein n=1 Tax=Thelephora terrestris TaxID=56493 RepID=A0A9P6HFN9_9AGAM|nr:Afadin and alpha-actinin-binding-domain-containing protein [Thelephora terrestris]